MKLGWRGAIGIALSLALLWWAFHDVPFGDVMARLARANLPLLLLAAAVGTCIFPLRARRWRTILDPVAMHLPFGKLWRATAIGMMVSNVVPARAGELARAYALTRETDRVPFSAAFASIAVDRVFDAAVVLLLMFVAMLDPHFGPGTTIQGRPIANYAGGGVVFAALVLGALYLMVFFPERIIGLFELLARRVAPRFETRGREMLVAFANGLGVLRSPRRFAAVFGWTLVHWLVNALAFWIAFRAVGIDHASFATALFLQGLIAIGVSLPQAPGFFGVFELLGKIGLGVVGVPEDLAVTWAVGYHIVSFIPITVIGAVYFARLGLAMGEVRRAGGEPAPAD